MLPETISPAAPSPGSRVITGSRLLGLPLAPTAALAALAWLPSIAQSPALYWSLTGAAAALLAGVVAVALTVRRRGGTPAVTISLRAQHYLQACAQGTVLLYWGWYWRPVYDAAPLLVAQLLFAYAFDMLLAWARRDDYTLGFAPFPVIFSTNLFLWFKADWFYLQFAMIALGFAAKELIRWDRDGRRVHIFNPSSFPLAVVSAVLLATGTTGMTWGPEIATTQFNPPNIYVILFLVGLPGQLLFGVTTMTASAVLTVYAFGVLYYWQTGVYFFIDSYIPIAVFLGMHLLFTDPSTSPRTESGRIVFGVLYGLGNIVLYEVLGRAGLPTFYDKLLPVPLMNLSVRFIDRVARGGWLSWIDPGRLLGGLRPLRRHAIYVGIWALAFGSLHAADAVGDNHPGHSVPFWQQACQANARNGCATLSGILNTYCAAGSPWACNEWGVLQVKLATPMRDLAPEAFKRSCSGNFRAGCQNTLVVSQGNTAGVQQGPPTAADYPILLRTGKGPLPAMEPWELFDRACDRGWRTACNDLAGILLQDPERRDPSGARAALERACDMGLAPGCSNLGLMHYTGDGVPKDTALGLQYLERACRSGLAPACAWLEEERSKAVK